MKIIHWLGLITAAAVAVALMAMTVTMVRPQARGERSKTIEGRMEPEVAVASAALGGKVESVLVRRGQSVKAGQVLVRFDARELDQRLSQAEAALRQAPAEVIATTASFVERVPPATWASLLQSDPARLVAEQEYVAALAAFEGERTASARVRLRRAEAQRVSAYQRADELRPQTLSKLENMRAEAQKTIRWLATQRDRLEVRSPVNGTVELLELAPGDTVLPGAAVALIDLPHRWVVTAPGRHASGTPVDLQLPGGTRLRASTVAAKDGLFRVLLSTQAADARAGAAVELQF